MARTRLKTTLMATAMAVTTFGAQAAEMNAAASGPSEEVVVTGTRDRDTSAEIAAQNTTTVLSAEDLARNPDTSVAEALSRIPGINVMSLGTQSNNSVSIDSAGRGVGTYVSVRGMNGEYNVNLINGVDVAEGEPYSREVSLSLLPPTGLDHIVVNKTMSADMEGDAIGGIIDFRMPTAYDFAQKYHASVSAGGRLEGQARDYGQDGLGDSFAADFAGKFGDRDQFGVYVGGYYDKRNFGNSEMGAIYPAQTNGMWAYAIQDAKGNNPGLNPADNLLLTGMDIGYTTGSTERLGANASFDWHPDDVTSAYARVTWSRANTEQESYQLQIYGDSFGTEAIGNGLYRPTIGGVQPRFWYETNPEHDVLGTAQVGGETRLGALTLAPNLFFSWGENDRPDHMEISARNKEKSDAIPFGGTDLFTYDGAFPQPLLTPSQIASSVTDIASYGARRAGELSASYSSQVKGGGKLDATWDAGYGPLQAVRFGAKYEDSFRQSTYRDWTSDKLFTTDANDPSLGSLGILSGSSVSKIYPGQYNWAIPTVNSNALWNFYNSHVASQTDAFDTCGSLYVNNWNCDTQRATEAVTSAYVSARLEWGDVTVIPGLRFEHSEINNTFWNMPTDASGNEIAGSWGSSKTTYNEALPSLAVNWRPDAGTVYRASIAQSYTRPAFFQLGGGEQSTHNDDGTVSITKGNPNLKPIIATNYDLSGEWSNASGGAASLGGFYKQIGDYIYDNNSQNSFVNAVVTKSGIQEISQPTNGGSAHVYGIELAVRQKFQNMPAPLDGLGIGGNMTWEQSAVHLGAAGLDPVERMQNQPNWMGNLQIFYEKDGINAALSYRYTGAYVTQYGVLASSSAFDEWVRPSEQVNFDAGYSFPFGLKTSFSVQNLTNERSFYATIGRTSTAIADIVDAGRTFFLTTTYTY